MPELNEAGAARARRERWAVAVGVVVLVIARSAVFVFWEESQFDSDQAVMGLAAKHLSELRAFPLFFYGSNHILAVEAWLAAPVFLVLGVSVTALKLPLLAVNVGIALLLLRLLERDAGLRPALALVPALFFVLPAPGTAAHFLDASGGNVEPFLYALLLWVTRQRPVVGGVIFAVGFLHREFTVYALLALLAVEAARGILLTGAGARRRFVMLIVSAATWVVVQLLKLVASPMGPGSSFGGGETRSNVEELSNRFCIDPSTVPGALSDMVTVHWPRLFGVQPQSLLNFAIDSTLWQGASVGWMVAAVAVVVAIVAVGRGIARERGWRAADDFCAYLVLVGLLSAAGLVLARCGHVEVMRYDLLSVLGLVGLGAWCLRAEPAPLVRWLWIAPACATVAIGGAASARLLNDYLVNRHVGAKRLIARQLEVRGVRFATSDYWLAYSLTFLTHERVIVASEDFVRIEAYQRMVEAHRDESVHVSRSRCDGGTFVAGVYFCR
jgi:hypothetical protein